MNKSNRLCVVGASGLVGSSIVRCALEKGYVVNGTLRDKNNEEKIKYLKGLPNGKNLIFYSLSIPIAGPSVSTCVKMKMRIVSFY